MKYPVDTNIWLELLLDQKQAENVRAFFDARESDEISIPEFSLYSIGVILSRQKKEKPLDDFFSDVSIRTDVVSPDTIINHLYSPATAT